MVLVLQEPVLATLLPPRLQQERFTNVLGREAAAHKPSATNEQGYPYTVPRVPNALCLQTVTKHCSAAGSLCWERRAAPEGSCCPEHQWM